MVLPLFKREKVSECNVKPWNVPWIHAVSLFALGGVVRRKLGVGSKIITMAMQSFEGML